MEKKNRLVESENDGDNYALVFKALIINLSGNLKKTLNVTINRADYFHGIVENWRDAKGVLPRTIPPKSFYSIR